MCDGESDYDSDNGADDQPETNANNGDASISSADNSTRSYDKIDASLFYLKDGDQDLMTDLDWEELEELQMLYGSSPRETRKEKWKYTRIDWNEFMQMKEHTGSFVRDFHMTMQQFETLVEILRESVQVNECGFPGDRQRN